MKFRFLLALALANVVQTGAQIALAHIRQDTLYLWCAAASLMCAVLVWPRKEQA